MKNLKKLSEAGLELMLAIWDINGPASVSQIDAALANEKKWALQTIHTMLIRLESKGFLASEKKGRERIFTPVVAREEYLMFESKNFLETVHKNSLLGMMDALYDGKNLSDKEIGDLYKWLEERK